MNQSTYKIVANVKIHADRYLRKYMEYKTAKSENEKNRILRLPEQYNEDRIREELVSEQNEFLDAVRKLKLPYTI